MLAELCRRCLVALVLLPWAAGAPAGAPAAETAPRYETMPASQHGIGKRFMGRQISRVMGYQGAAWLERSEREQEERSDLLLAELRLEPGMVVADVGAGTGYYTRRFAPLVGPIGAVYAVDVQPQMLERLEALARQPGLAHIKPVLGSADDAKLPAGSVDLAILIDVYHELEHPYEALASVVRALKPGGRLVLVEYRAEDERVPIAPLHKMSEAQVRREAALHPLRWERTSATLPWQHVIVFRKQ